MEDGWPVDGPTRDARAKFMIALAGPFIIFEIMTLSLTGLVYLLGFLGTAFLALRFLQYWRQEGAIISKLFFYFVSIFSLSVFITALGALFFAENAAVLRLVVICATFLQGFAFALVGYMVTYILFPRVSSWFGFWPIIAIGLMATILTIIIPFNPFLAPSGVINWDIKLWPGLLRLLAVLITLVPLAAVLFREFITTRDLSVRTRSIGIVILLFFGLIITFIDFLSGYFFGLGSGVNNFVLGFLAVALFALLLFIPKPPSPSYVKKI